MRLLLLLMLALPGMARAQAWPERPVQIVNPYAAGSTTDILTRALANGLQPRLGQPVAVLNRDGAAGGVGTAFVARAPADGYTLLFAPAVVFSVLAKVRPEIGFTLESFTPVCQVFENTAVLAVRQDSPLRSLADLVAAAKARPGSVNYGHQGVASVTHLAALAWTQLAGIDWQDIPLRSEPQVVTETVAGRVEVAALVAGSLHNQPLRPIAVFGRERHPALPDSPTAIEQGFNLAPASFGGIFAPAGTPAAVLARLAPACAEAAAEPAYREIARRSYQPERYYLPTAEFTTRLHEEVAEKARLLAGLRIER